MEQFPNKPTMDQLLALEQEAERIRLCVKHELCPTCGAVLKDFTQNGSLYDAYYKVCSKEADKHFITRTGESSFKY